MQRGGWAIRARRSSCCSPRIATRRAAAGLSIDPSRVEEFAERFAEQAAGVLAEEDLLPLTRVDAVLPRGQKLTLDLCAELARLAPFGLGNPEVTLLAAGCELAELATVGEGKHLRFRVRQDGFDAGSAIAFGQGSSLDRFRREGAYDVAFRLEENRWNGTSAPQLVVRRIFDADDRFQELRTWLAAEFHKSVELRDPIAVEVFAELELDGAAGRRHLLESERFRALLAEPALARAA